MYGLLSTGEEVGQKGTLHFPLTSPFTQLHSHSTHSNDTTRTPLDSLNTTNKDNQTNTLSSQQSSSNNNSNNTPKEFSLRGTRFALFVDRMSGRHPLQKRHYVNQVFGIPTVLANQSKTLQEVQPSLESNRIDRIDMII